MKKILQRIGLLAMAGMLLWGWQGMNAKAADDIFTFKCDGPHIDKTKLKVVQEGNNYHFDIYPEDGYAFTQKPAASLDDDTAGATVGTFIVDKASDNTFYSCSIGNVSLDSTRKYSIRIYVYDIYNRNHENTYHANRAGDRTNASFYMGHQYNRCA